MRPKVRHEAYSEPDALGGRDAYGFEWGPMHVVRLAHIQGRGYWLVVQTDHDERTIHVSERGSIVRIEA